MTERKTTVTGRVMAHEVKTSKRGNAYSIIKVAPDGERNGEYDTGVFEIVAAGDAATLAKPVQRGDTARFECAVTASEWNGRTFMRLALEGLKDHITPAPSAAGETPDASGDADMPF